MYTTSVQTNGQLGRQPPGKFPRWATIPRVCSQIGHKAVLCSYQLSLELATACNEGKPFVNFYSRRANASTFIVSFLLQTIAKLPASFETNGNGTLDLTTLQCQTQNGSAVTALFQTKDGNTVYGGDADGFVYAWDAENGKLKLTIGKMERFVCVKQCIGYWVYLLEANSYWMRVD